MDVRRAKKKADAEGEGGEHDIDEAGDADADFAPCRYSRLISWLFALSEQGLALDAFSG